MHWNFSASVQYSCRWLIKMHISQLQALYTHEIYTVLMKVAYQDVSYYNYVHTQEISFEWQANAQLGCTLLHLDDVA